MTPRSLLSFFCLSIVLSLSPGLWAETAQQVPAQSDTASAASQAEALYHQALNAYLEGDYDKALLLSAQSLNKDSGHVKTKNLINILAAEKDQEGKTVIWISGKPSLAQAEPIAQVTPPPAPARDDSRLEGAIESLRAGMDRFFGLQNRKNGQLDSQIRVIQELIKSNSDNKYKELQLALEELTKRMDKIKTDGQDLRLLYLLCGASVFFSLVALFRKSKSA